jgi:hypothetical protein
MTRPEAEELVLKWDRVALRRGDAAKRKSLWRILDCLAGWREPNECVDDLDALNQTDEVNEIREALGLELRDAPMWAGRV